MSVSTPTFTGCAAFCACASMSGNAARATVASRVASLRIGTLSGSTRAGVWRAARVLSREAREPAPARRAGADRRQRPRGPADAGRRSSAARTRSGRRASAHPAAAAPGPCAGDAAPARPGRVCLPRPVGAVRLRAAGPSRRADAARAGAGARPRTPQRDGGATGAVAGIVRAPTATAGRRSGLALNAAAAGLAARMGRAGWGWAGFVCAALGAPGAAPSAEALRVWRRLPEWEEAPPPPPPSAHPVSEAEARARLAAMLGSEAEQRPGQSDYAGAAAAAFAPRAERGAPHMVLAEAGTGSGKTLGYIAPASLWAERNGGAVWISTFTRHLQRQIDAELARLYPDPAVRRRRVVVRKGRENYLCLLNLEDAVVRAHPAEAVALGLVARWAMVSADGDIQGGDLPGWIAELFGPASILGLADRRGECIHAACPHWRRCFVEHTIRRARSAELVVANHALVMTQAAWGGLDEAAVPTALRIRRGPPRLRRRRRRLRRGFFGRRSGGAAPLAAGRRGRAIACARPAPAAGGAGRRQGRVGAVSRCRPEAPPARCRKAAGRCGSPRRRRRLPDWKRRRNPSEAFLRLLRRQVLARIAGAEPELPANGALECDLHPVIPSLARRRRAAGTGAGPVAEPLRTFARTPDGAARR